MAIEVKYIAFSPFILNQNKYIEIMQSLIRDNGFKIVSISQSFSSYNCFKKTKVYHLNWFEILNSKYKTGIFFQVLSKAFFLLFLNILNKKVVFTLHNKFQHDAKGAFYHKLVLKIIILFSNKVIIHSKSSKDFLINRFIDVLEYEKKVVYIPHPNYIEDYGDIHISTNKSESSSLNLLFLGSIRPYKNIELLIEVISCFSIVEVNLHIAGNYSSIDYKNKIIDMCRHIKNVTFDLRYIESNEIPKIISSFDLMVFPYDSSSVLNSGSLLLSFSYKKSALIPLVGTALDFKNKSHFFYYKYLNKSQHFSELKSGIRRLIELKKNDINIFNKIGESAYFQVLENNSKNLVKEKLCVLYNELLC